MGTALLVSPREELPRFIRLTSCRALRVQSLMDTKSNRFLLSRPYWVRVRVLRSDHGD
jgi:hypothetical protein